MMPLHTPQISDYILYSIKNNRPIQQMKSCSVVFRFVLQCLEPPSLSKTPIVSNVSKSLKC
jgi:hypothetical protein